MKTSPGAKLLEQQRTINDHYDQRYGTIIDIIIPKMMATLKMWLLLFFMLYPGPSFVGGAWMMCTLNAIPAENATVPSTVLLSNV